MKLKSNISSKSIVGVLVHSSAVSEFQLNVYIAFCSYVYKHKLAVFIIQINFEMDNMEDDRNLFSFQKHNEIGL